MLPSRPSWLPEAQALREFYIAILANLLRIVPDQAARFGNELSA